MPNWWPFSRRKDPPIVSDDDMLWAVITKSLRNEPEAWRPVHNGRDGPIYWLDHPSISVAIYIGGGISYLTAGRYGGPSGYGVGDKVTPRDIGSGNNGTRVTGQWAKPMWDAAEAIRAHGQRHKRLDEIDETLAGFERHLGA